MANLIVEAVDQTEVGVATGINTIMRSIGGSLGAQIAAAIIAGHVAAGGLPAEHGFVLAFAMSSVALLLATGIALAIPAHGGAGAPGAAFATGPHWRWPGFAPASALAEARRRSPPRRSIASRVDRPVHQDASPDRSPRPTAIWRACSSAGGRPRQRGPDRRARGRRRSPFRGLRPGTRHPRSCPEVRLSARGSERDSRCRAP